MSTLNERIKKLRRSLDLTQQEFAEKIGTARNNIAGYETGKRSPSEAVISLICREFNVSKTWLLTGEGEMFVKRTEEDKLTAAVDRLITGESAEFKRRLVSALSTLKDEHWFLLEQKLKEIVGMRDSVDSPAIPDADRKQRAEMDTSGQERIGADRTGQERTEPDLVAKVAELERQNRALAAKVAAMEEEDALLALTAKSSASPSASVGSPDPAERAKK